MHNRSEFVTFLFLLKYTLQVFCRLYGLYKPSFRPKIVLQALYHQKDFQDLVQSLWSSHSIPHSPPESLRDMIQQLLDVGRCSQFKTV